MPPSFTFNDLAPLAAEIRSFIARNAEKSSRTEAGRTSAFWSEILESRGNFPDMNALTVCRREGATSGIDTDTLASVAAEQVYAGRMHHIFRHKLPHDYAASLPESMFGAPYVFEHDGLVRSAAFWLQCSTSQRILELARRFGPNRPLRVLEIGAGMGMCAQHLHAKTAIESYAIVDLPENIYVSSLALSLSLPQRKARFHDMDGDRLEQLAPDSVHFFLPGAIERIGAKFDLVVNSFSMQEMAIGNVDAYIDWIGTVLSDDGIFVSFNSHAKAGVKQPSDYRYDKFHIHHWGVFRQTPPEWFNTIPYEVVLGRRREASPAYPAEAQNAIGWLMQFGLDSNLKSFCGALVGGTLDASRVQLLQAYQAFFVAGSDEAREQALQAAAAFDRSAILPFLRAHLALVYDDAEGCAAALRQALASGLSDFARLRAELMLSVLARRAGRDLPVPTLDGLDIAAAYPDVHALTRTGHLDPLIGHACHVLGRPFTRSFLNRIAVRLGR